MGSVDAASFVGIAPSVNLGIDDHIGQQDGKYYLSLGGCFIQFDKREDAVRFAAFLSQRSGKALSELSIIDVGTLLGTLKGAGQNNGDLFQPISVRQNHFAYLTINGREVSAGTFKLTGNFTQLMSQLEASKGGAGKVPYAFLLNGVAPVSSSWFADKSKHPSLSDAQWRNLIALQLASVSSSANELYRSNGFDKGTDESGAKVTAVVSPSTGLSQLVKALFGVDSVNTGHVAVLSALGLIEQVNQGVNTGTVLTQTGAALIKQMGAQGELQPPRMMGSADLDQLTLTTLAQTFDPDLLFGANGLAAGKTLADVKAAADKLLGVMLPNGLRETFLNPSDGPHLSDDTKKVLAKLFGESALHSVQKLNVAVMMGLIEIKGNGAVEVTARGTALLNVQDTPAAGSGSQTNTATPNDPLGSKQSDDVRLALAWKAVKDLGLTDYLDVGRDKRGRDGDISWQDLEGIANLGEDFWNQRPQNRGRGGMYDPRGDLASVPVHLRKPLVNLAKFLMKMMNDTTGGQSFRQIFMPGESTTRMDRIQTFIDKVAAENSSFNELFGQITPDYLKNLTV